MDSIHLFMRNLCVNRGYEPFTELTDSPKDTKIFFSLSGVHVILCDKAGSPKNQVVTTLDLGDHLIYVCDMSRSTSALKVLHESGKRCETFHPKNIDYNPIVHQLVPRFELVQDKSSIAEPHNLHFLKTTGIVAKFMGFREGDIVKVSPKDGSTPFYKYVTDEE